jgi:hypothetical protein
MLITVEGQFKSGRVLLAEAPAGIEQAKVIVTFLPSAGQAAGLTPIYFGMFKGDRKTDPDDFQSAEWRGPSGE